MHFQKTKFEMSISGFNISFWISKKDNGCGLTNIQMPWNTKEASSSKRLEFLDTCNFNTWMDVCELGGVSYHQLQFNTKST
jgi:hypothetical protein